MNKTIQSKHQQYLDILTSKFPCKNDKDSIYERQLIDANCNDCAFMTRDVEKLNLHKESYNGTGFSDELLFGKCNLLNKEISFIPNICQIETQGCFKHRKLSTELGS